MLIYGIIFPRWRVAADVSLGSWKIFRRFFPSLFRPIIASAGRKCYTAPAIIPLLFLSPSLISFKSSFGHSPSLDTVDRSVVLWYNEEKRTGVFLHGEQLSTARYVRCDVGNSQAVHNRKQGNVGRERKGYPSISEWRVLDFENGSTMERPAAGIW